jgi:hypothetical protein
VSGAGTSGARGARTASVARPGHVARGALSALFGFTRSDYVRGHPIRQVLLLATVALLVALLPLLGSGIGGAVLYVIVVAGAALLWRRSYVHHEQLRPERAARRAANRRADQRRKDALARGIALRYVGGHPDLTAATAVFLERSPDGTHVWMRSDIDGPVLLDVDSSTIHSVALVPGGRADGAGAAIGGAVMGDVLYGATGAVVGAIAGAATSDGEVIAWTLEDHGRVLNLVLEGTGGSSSRQAYAKAAAVLAPRLRPSG